jgi:DNA replication initiation complex subunit (GINS family)|tara:strand:+ start:22001 stop:22744 length:744 start_codon:yes stop_codon:yes gene_type:complete
MGNTLNNHFNAKIMTADLMTLRDLRVQTFKERREGRLTKLPSSFYTRMKKLENQIRTVIKDTKNDQTKFAKANADIRKFMDMKLELHKHRERKLTDLAREKINGQGPNTENAHKSEIEYLIALCGVIENHRKKTLLSKDINSIEELIIDENIIEEPKIDENIIEEPEIDENIIEEPEIDENIIEEPKKMVHNEEYLKVQVLEDLPTFTGMDANNYTLKNEDIADIPIYNAKILSDAGKVKIIKEVKA